MTKLSRLATAAGLLLAGAALAQPPATPVQVDAVVNQAGGQQVRLIGRIVAPESGAVAARTFGTIAEYKVRVGDRIDKGTVLAQLDQAAQRANLYQARADLARAVAEAELAKVQLNRVARLKGSPAFDESLFDQRTQEHAMAKASADRARVQLAIAEEDMEYTHVRAPYAGVVTARLSSPGDWVGRGEGVVEMVNDAQVEFELALPGHVADQPIEPEILVDLGTGTTTGTLRAILPSENPASRTRLARFEPSESDIRLVANAAISATVTIGGQPRPTVHKDAVLRNPQGAMVYVVSDGTAQPRPVQLGEAVGDRFQVLSGLTEGDEVVIRGNERLRPGQAVVAAPAAAGDAS